MSKDQLPASAKDDKANLEAPVGNADPGAPGTVLDSELRNGKGKEVVPGAAVRTEEAVDAEPEKPKDLGQTPPSGGVYVADKHSNVKPSEETE